MKAWMTATRPVDRWATRRQRLPAVAQAVASKEVGPAESHRRRSTCWLFLPCCGRTGRLLQWGSRPRSGSRSACFIRCQQLLRLRIHAGGAFFLCTRT